MKRLYTAILILSVILGASLFALIQCYQFQQQAVPLLQQVLTGTSLWSESPILPPVWNILPDMTMSHS